MSFPQGITKTVLELMCGIQLIVPGILVLLIVEF